VALHVCGRILSDRVAQRGWPAGHPRVNARHVHAGAARAGPGGTGGARRLAALGSIPPVCRLAPGFSIFCAFQRPRRRSGPVRPLRFRFFAGFHLHHLKNILLHATVAWGGQLRPRKKESSPRRRGGAPHSQVSSPINRDLSPHFKTHKRRALKKQSAATIIVTK
jgi:hypothetical protein